MAHQVGNNQDVTDKLRATAASVAKPGATVATPANYDNETALDARLVALTYTQARINQMNRNDKIYAIRLADDAGTI